MYEDMGSTEYIQCMFNFMLFLNSCTELKKLCKSQKEIILQNC